MFEEELPDFLSTLTPDEPINWMVDKDYWLTRVLRRLSVEMGGAFLFKGGTSLSMGYGLIDRFSEDIDLLVVTEPAETAIDDITRISAEELGDDGDVIRKGDAYRFMLFNYRYTHQAPASSSNLRTIRLDMGVQGGTHPSEPRAISPVASRLLTERGLDPGTYDDLLPFELELLHPARTCLEKLEMINQTAAEVATGRTDTVETRTGKHPYDVFQILGHEPSIEMLSDETERSRILDSIDDAGQRWFGTPLTRPDHGYAASDAFGGGEASVTFEIAYQKALKAFLWPNANAPQWKEVVDRVLGSASIL